MRTVTSLLNRSQIPLSKWTWYLRKIVTTNRRMPRTGETNRRFAPAPGLHFQKLLQSKVAAQSYYLELTIRSKIFLVFYSPPAYPHLLVRIRFQLLLILLESKNVKIIHILAHQ